MKWLLCTMIGTLLGYYIFRVQNSEVHGELALELHRNIVLADRAERAEILLKRVDALLDAVLLVPQSRCSDGAWIRPTVAVIRDEGQA